MSLPGQLSNLVQRAIRRMRVRRCEVPFAMWFRGRSGSTHLCSLLQCHPQVVCRKEDFHETFREPELNSDQMGDGSHVSGRELTDFDHQMVPDPTAKRAITHLHNIFACPAKACGFKFKYPSQHQLYPEVVSELKSLGKRLRLIVLSRRNFLKQAISRQNLDRIQEPGKLRSNLTVKDGDDRKQQQPFRVDVRRVVNYAARLKGHHEQLLEAAWGFEQSTGCSVFRVDYEELLEDRDDVMKRLFAFLSVDTSCPVESYLRKATSDDLSAAISNFDELEAAVRGTEYWEMLHEGNSSGA